MQVGDWLPPNHIISHCANENLSLLLSRNNPEDLVDIDEVSLLLRGFLDPIPEEKLPAPVLSAFVTPLLDQDSGEVSGMVVAINKVTSLAMFGKKNKHSSISQIESSQPHSAPCMSPTSSVGLATVRSGPADTNQDLSIGGAQVMNRSSRSNLDFAKFKQSPSSSLEDKPSDEEDDDDEPAVKFEPPPTDRFHRDGTHHPGEGDRRRLIESASP